MPKKEDGAGNPRWRLLVDFRPLNEKTVAGTHPIPNIVDIFYQVGGATYYSIFDCVSSFDRLAMDLHDIYKTAFTTPQGHIEFVRIPVGMKNAAAK